MSNQKSPLKVWLNNLAFAALASLVGGVGHAVEISVLVNMGDREVIEDLGRAFRQATGNSVVIRYKQGNSLDLLMEGGVPADIFTGSPESTDGYVAKGDILAGSRTDFARSGVGLSVKAGAPKPDISTPEKFKRAMLGAQSIGHSSSSAAARGSENRAGSGGITVDAFEKLGISEQVKSRTKLIDGTPVAAVVARGEVQYGLQQINVLRQVPGADYVGPLPGNLQAYVRFTMGVLSASKHQDVATAFTRFVVAPENAEIIRRNYLESWSDQPRSEPPTRSSIQR